MGKQVCHSVRRAYGAKAQVMVLKWEGVTLQRGDPKVCEGGKGVYG